MQSLLKIFKQSTVHVFNAEGKYALVFFRGIILILVIFFILYSNNENSSLILKNSIYFRWLLTLAFLQTLSNIFLIFIPQPSLKKGYTVAFFLFDIALVSLAIYWTQGFDTDLFLIYFLVLFMTVISRQIVLSFTVAGLACFLYGFLFLKTHQPAEFMQSAVLIRFPLLLVGAFFSAAITRDVEIEKDLISARLHALWQQSEKLATLGEMTSEIVHEINNPLTSISGTIQLLLFDIGRLPADSNDKVKNPAPLATHVEVSTEDLLTIERNVNRCKEVLQRIDRFAVDQDFQFKNIDSKKILLDVLARMSAQIESQNIQVKWGPALTPSERTLLASAPHIHQVLYHIVLNSLWAMPEGGQLTLRMERSRVTNSRYLPVDYLDIIIQDSGVGIAPEYLEQPFQNFIAAPQVHKKLGLGLIIAHNIVSKHNGKIFIQSSGPNQGTTVRVRLPAAESPESDIPDAVRAGRSQKIILT